MRADEHDLGRVILRQTCGQRLCNDAGRKVLVFDVDAPFSGGNCVQVERLDLPNRRPATPRGLGARDPDLDPGYVGRHSVRPDIGGSRNGSEPLAGRSIPTLSGKLAVSSSDVSLDDNLDVVE